MRKGETLSGQVTTTGKLATRQKVRLILLFLIMLTFPITLNYFSVFLIIESSSQGIIAASFIFWSLFTITALLFGRAACGYVCPLGAIQETKDRMVPKRLARIKYLKILKYILAVGWIAGIVVAVVSAGGYRSVDLLYNTESGVSVDSPQGWITYVMIVGIILLPGFFIGKRGFCHYFCPWGVLNMTATKVKYFFRWPSLHLEADKNNCKQCHTCSTNCPMSLPVSAMVLSSSMRNSECILCGTCADTCPNGAISYSWSRPAKGE